MKLQPSGALAGVQVEELAPQIARELKLPMRTGGVVITDVATTRPAADAGLQRGEVIQEVNRKVVTSVAEPAYQCRSGERTNPAAHQPGRNYELLCGAGAMRS